MSLNDHRELENEIDALALATEKERELKHKKEAKRLRFITIAVCLPAILLLVAWSVVNLWSYDNISSGELKTVKTTYSQGDLVVLLATQFCWDGTPYTAQPFVTRSKVLRQLPFTIHEGYTPEEEKALANAPGHCINNPKGVPVAQIELPKDSRPGPHRIRYEITYRVGPFNLHTENISIESNVFTVVGTPDSVPGR